MTLRRVGEGLALEGLAHSDQAPLARAVESDATSSVFIAPRSAADRYPDWAAFEYSCRQGERGAETRVWRIAEDSNRVCFLGQSFHAKGAIYPLGAALWRGWPLNSQAHGRALYWQGALQGHLWLSCAGQFPRHVGITGIASAEALLVALSCHDDLRALTLELGGVADDFRSELTAHFPGPIVPAEPFADLQVPNPLREILLDLEDPTVYLPAVGAARALLEGPPAPLARCELSQAAAAVVG